MRKSSDEIGYLVLTGLVLFILLNGYSIYAQTPGTPTICLNTKQHLLFHEDTSAVTSKFIAKTRDGNLLIPGYYYPNNGVNYFMPYLIKCTKEGEILWSKKYFSLGIYASKWFTATMIKELSNGDLFMTGQIVVPGTDDRRELAAWKLDKNGNLIWGKSYESKIWTNPITGATEVTGIEEDGDGNVFICGELKIFEAPKFAFVLKIDRSGKILWDKNFSSDKALAYGVLQTQNGLSFIGSIVPVSLGTKQNTAILWSLQLNTGNGLVNNTKAWYADYGDQSYPNSFAFTNVSVCLLDDGQISVHGAAYSDFQGLFSITPGIINHSIIANFSPGFDYHSGIMLSSAHASNFYNTVTTQHSNGRISYTRFAENNDLYNEEIIFGSIQNNQIIKERIYHEQGRSGASASNLLNYAPDQDVLIQAYWDKSNVKGGLEFFNLLDKDSVNPCNGKDTSMTFIQPYYMKETQVVFDSVVLNAFRPTDHNYIGASDGNLTASADCTLPGTLVLASPVISINKDSVLCKGTSRELTAGGGYSQYTWNNGETGASIIVSDTGQYRVTVTAANGCKASDSVNITKIMAAPSDFLPGDTTICEFEKLTISTAYLFQDYLWSDHSTGPALTVSQPGLYSLDATDSNHCVGHDSIRVAQKQCLEGLFVPNAFTPNGDGLNDVFTPFVSGNLIEYKFTIYDRWGEKVFESKTSGQGWDGKIHGMGAATGVFVWYCRYQLAAQAEKIKKGTLLLIR